MIGIFGSAPPPAVAQRVLEPLQRRDLAREAPPVPASVDQFVSPSQSLLFKEVEKLLRRPLETAENKARMLTLLQQATPAELAYIRDHVRMSCLLTQFSGETLNAVFARKGLTMLHDRVASPGGGAVLDYDRLPYGLNAITPLRPGAPTMVIVHGIASPLREWQGFADSYRHLHPDHNLLIYKYDYGGEPNLLAASLRKGLLNLARDYRLSELAVTAHSMGAFVSYGALQAAEADGGFFANRRLDGTGRYLNESPAEAQLLAGLKLDFTTVASPLKGSWALDLGRKLNRIGPRDGRYYVPYWLSSGEVMSAEGDYMRYVGQHQLLSNLKLRRVINRDDELCANFIFPKNPQDPKDAGLPGLSVSDAVKKRLAGPSHDLAPTGFLYWQILQKEVPQAGDLFAAVDQLSIGRLIELSIRPEQLVTMLRHNSNQKDDARIAPLMARMLDYEREHPGSFPQGLDQEAALFSEAWVWDLLRVTGFTQANSSLAEPASRQAALERLQLLKPATRQQLLNQLRPNPRSSKQTPTALDLRREKAYETLKREWK